MKQAKKSGFTLIELLVALAILGIIVVICGRIFEQSSLSWSTGTRKAEMSMVGRGLADFIAQDIGRSVARSSADFTAGGSSLKFKIIDEAAVAENSATKPLMDVIYDLGALKRNGIELAPDGMVQGVTVTKGPVAAGDLPGYVDVEVVVKDVDVSSYTVTYKSRAWLANRDRYKYEED